MGVYILLVMIFTVGADLAYAASDPLAVINNLSTFIFALIRAIGLILLGFGIVQIGLSLKSHDLSQRANGFLTLAGGVIITFAKEILALLRMLGWRILQGFQSLFHFLKKRCFHRLLREYPTDSLL